MVIIAATEVPIAVLMIYFIWVAKKHSKEGEVQQEKNVPASPMVIDGDEQNELSSASE